MFKFFKVIRVVIKAVRDGKILMIDAEGNGQTFINKEMFQAYGFCSKPLPGSEGILLPLGRDNAVVIATEDRRYRLEIQNGEVGLYTDEGDFVLLKRNKEIHLVTGNKLTIDATNDVFINTNRSTVNATGKVEVNAGGGVDIDGGTANNKGVVQGDSICHFTGLPHSDISTNVKASK